MSVSSRIRCGPASAAAPPETTTAMATSRTAAAADVRRGSTIFLLVSTHREAVGCGEDARGAESIFNLEQGRSCHLDEQVLT
jgi:hypothetical protein